MGGTPGLKEWIAGWGHPDHDRRSLVVEGKASTKHPTFGDDQARKYRKHGGGTLGG